ncbi:non-specific lipid-transfer protein 1 isoform X2 [Quercus lobata]|uniref:Bifunctional inhibitor/plant lipid transfer protein/seed storage helical domain-containing protein n=1 Tax=Quercus lobata TaxID=97700 RepID=A0A7N2N536_QUELO|nr:non-specific lipid-transfer protein 1 isoform X2 [Quercus lobata]
MGIHNLATLMSISVVVLMMVTSVAKAQTADCASKLVPCASFINSTSPPASCCNPIKEAVATQLPCLCALYTSPGVLKSFGITVEQALNLTRACGVGTDVTKCNATAPSPTSGSVTPSGVPGSDGNGAGRIAWTGFSTLFFFLASMMFY